VVTGQQMRAALSVPVQLEGGPIGSVDLYSAEPRDWDQAEISAAQVYAALAATLLSQAVAAQVKGRPAEQLQVALEHPHPPTSWCCPRSWLAIKCSAMSSWFKQPTSSGALEGWFCQLGVGTETARAHTRSCVLSVGNLPPQPAQFLELSA
jgi:hypothetical protein